MSSVFLTPIVKTSRLSSKPSYCQIVRRRQAGARHPMLRRDRIMTIAALSTATGTVQKKARVLWVACGAHALHDGFTDTLYVLLPLWQAQFALSYAAIGILRALYAGVMAGLQVPVAGLAQRIGGARILAAGTAAAAA